MNMQHETKEMFKTLTELAGPPGFEHDVRAFMKEELNKYSDEIVQDRLGSTFGLKKRSRRRTKGARRRSYG